MKQLKDLPQEIYKLFLGKGHTIKSDIGEFANALARRIQGALEQSDAQPYLRPSNIGTPCARQLWYKIRHPELSEPVPPWTRIKFLYGHILEELVLFLAQEAGYDISDKQKTVDFNGVTGSIDGVIDGTVVDVKSAATFSFDKFKEGLTDANDAFGYRRQLGLYGNAIGAKKGAFIAIDKQHGHITVDEHPITDMTAYVEKRKAIVESDTKPPREFLDEPEGKSGNMKLGVNCSYCDFKRACWPGLRSFAYARGPVHLTEIKKLPDVPEIT